MCLFFIMTIVFILWRGIYTLTWHVLYANCIGAQQNTPWIYLPNCCSYMKLYFIWFILLVFNLDMNSHSTCITSKCYSQEWICVFSEALINPYRPDFWMTDLVEFSNLDNRIIWQSNFHWEFCSIFFHLACSSTLPMGAESFNFSKLKNKKFTAWRKIRNWHVCRMVTLIYNYLQIPEAQSTWTGEETCLVHNSFLVPTRLDILFFFFAYHKIIGLPFEKFIPKVLESIPLLLKGL